MFMQSCKMVTIGVLIKEISPLLDFNSILVAYLFNMHPPDVSMYKNLML
jgi:hypothetical protein